MRDDDRAETRRVSRDNSYARKAGFKRALERRVSIENQAGIESRSSRGRILLVGFEILFFRIRSSLLLSRSVFTLAPKRARYFDASLPPRRISQRLSINPRGRLYRRCTSVEIKTYINICRTRRRESGDDGARDKPSPVICSIICKPFPLL